MVIQSSEQFSVHLLPVIVNGDERRCRLRGALAIVRKDQRMVRRVESRVPR
jgi:hypothetical protein